MTHPFDTVVKLLSADTRDLKELAKIAGADHRSFYLGADTTGLDLRGQDVRDIEFSNLNLSKVLIDDATRLPGSRARVLILEDEPIIAMDLANQVKDIGHEVAGTASTEREAIELALQTQPDLFLADIKLDDGAGSGLAAANEIVSRLGIRVIFITAYPERLLTAERPDPTYLIAKPFLPETVKKTILQALYESRATSKGK